MTAFARTPAPGGRFEDISATPDDEDIVEYFRGTSRFGHDVAMLRFHSVALSFFTDAAYRYWLPSFMLAVLDHPGEADVIPEFIVSSLMRRGPLSLPQEELEAIAAFLEACADLEIGNELDCRDTARMVRTWGTT